MATLTFAGLRKVRTSKQNIVIPCYESDTNFTQVSSISYGLNVSLPSGFQIEGSMPVTIDSNRVLGKIDSGETITAGGTVTTITTRSYTNPDYVSAGFTNSYVQGPYNFVSIAAYKDSSPISGYYDSTDRLCFILTPDGKKILTGINQISRGRCSSYSVESASSTAWGYGVFILNEQVARDITYPTGADTPAAQIYDASRPYQPDTDPYAPAGDSGTGGGGGSWDDGSDPVPIPSLPSVGATDTGFISLFVPTQAQLQQVANYLWSSLFDVSTFYKIFENPMDCILGLSVVPVSIPTSGNAQITIGNIELSGITLPLASQQYVEVDCGSLTVSPYFGSYLDYEPYTKMSLFVPYSGVHTINADDIMSKTVNLVYHIDILTGSLVAFLKCGDSVLYEFNGACGSNIPVNSVNYASTIENAIRIAVNIGTTVATAGASAPATMATEAARAGQEVARGLTLAGSTAEGILSLKPNIDRAGSLGGTTGLLGNQTPYFIITRPRLCRPERQNFYKGYPAFITYYVSDLIGKGYTEFDTIILSTLYLTDDEKNELESIMAGGVYL